MKTIAGFLQPWGKRSKCISFRHSNRVDQLGKSKNWCWDKLPDPSTIYLFNCGSLCVDYHSGCVYNCNCHRLSSEGAVGNYVGLGGTTTSGVCCTESHRRRDRCRDRYFADNRRRDTSDVADRCTITFYAHFDGQLRSQVGIWCNGCSHGAGNTSGAW